MKMISHFYDKIHGWFSFAGIYSRMVDHFPDGAKFVEIGSWYGRSTAYMAVEIANSGKRIEFAAVDTWEGSEEHKPGGSVADRNIVAKGTIYDEFLRNMEQVKDFVLPYRMTSLQAASLMADRSLDFVFIDAAHDYDNVKADIAAWHPKVKLGGFIGGHDYTPSWPGVCQAVNEKYGNFETGQDSWLVRKNK